MSLKRSPASPILLHWRLWQYRLISTPPSWNANTLACSRQACSTHMVRGETTHSCHKSRLQHAMLDLTSYPSVPAALTHHTRACKADCLSETVHTWHPHPYCWPPGTEYPQVLANLVPYICLHAILPVWLGNPPKATPDHMIHAWYTTTAHHRCARCARSVKINMTPKPG